jgi:N-acetylmuramoyl-L-alanine amidase
MSTCRRALLRDAIAVAALAISTAVPAVAAPHRRVRHRGHARYRPKPLIVVDPGHGGKDPGCIGLGGTQEKDVVLALGRLLARELLGSGRFRVAMTRSTDVFIPLERRVAFAREQRAALFISLHGNASHDHHACGSCIYRFAYRASSVSAAMKARWENSRDQVGGSAFRDASPIVAGILGSLMRRETWLHSARLQQSIVTSLGHRTPKSMVTADHAHFVVLSAPDIASVLVETGFLTNPAEERQLRSSGHRRLLAQAMRQGVEHYFARL